MNKEEFLAHFAAMYKVANRSDHETREDWTHPRMAGSACCQLLDNMGVELVNCGVLTNDEYDELYLGL